jgi:hypothetical protein
MERDGRPLHGWIGAMRITAQAVVLLLKRRAARPGLDSEQVAGDSRRAGLPTSAAGAAECIIAEQNGPRGTSTLQRHIPEASLFREKAVGAVGP